MTVARAEQMFILFSIKSWGETQQRTELMNANDYNIEIGKKTLQFVINIIRFAMLLN